MAKKQSHKRSPRLRKSDRHEFVAQSAASAQTPPEIPSEITPQRQDEASPSPSKWRYHLGMAGLTTFVLLIGVAAGFYLGSRTDRTAPAGGSNLPSDTLSQHEREQARQTLVLIQEELVENARVLKLRREAGPRNPQAPFQFLKNDFWRALSNNSEIRWVTDITLLDAITRAYHYVDEIKLLERKNIEMISTTVAQTPMDNANRRLIVASLAEVSPLAEKSIVDAAVKIDQKLLSK